MTDYKELIEKAKQSTKQELGDQWSGNWRMVDRMPDSFYWDDLQHMLKNKPRDLVIEQDEIGIVINRVTRKGTDLGKLGGKKRIATEDLHDLRRFS